MRVRDFMTTSPISVTPNTSMAEARELMRRRRIRHLLVLEGEQLMGILTDRDIRLNLPSPATSLSIWEINCLLAKMTVKEIMTKSVITVGPDRHARDAVGLMLDHQIGALPVLEGERVVGILTETDMLRVFAMMQPSTSAVA